MATDDPTPSRPGSGADLVRRIDRLELSHEALAKDVASLASTVSRVELNQTHAAELNKLRFDSLDAGLGGVRDELGRFMARINAIVTGEVQTPQSIQGEKLVVDYLAWRETVETRLDAGSAFQVQGKLIARIAVILIGGNAIAVIAAIAAVLK